MFVVGVFNCIEGDEYGDVMCAYVFWILNLWLLWEVG